MGFGEAVSSVFSKYATFSGRARRSEYWYFALFYALVDLVIVGVLGAVLGTDSKIYTIINGIFGLAMLLPNLSVTARRLHDIGKSGWWMLIELVPIVGVILMIVWCAKDSEPGDNEYGPNPKY